MNASPAGEPESPAATAPPDVRDMSMHDLAREAARQLRPVLDRLAPLDSGEPDAELVDRVAEAICKEETAGAVTWPNIFFASRDQYRRFARAALAAVPARALPSREAIVTALWSAVSVWWTGNHEKIEDVPIGDQHRVLGIDAAAQAVLALLGAPATDDARD